MIHAGIDYSLTSPAVCVFNDKDEFCWNEVNVHFLSDIRKTQGNNGNVFGSPFHTYKSDQERYDGIAKWVFSVLNVYNVENVFIEDYSYGSTGRVFHIAENAGVLKQKLWKYEIKFETIAPTVIKKFATGKGNASKQRMEEVFVEETGVDLRGMLSLTDKQNNPISDIIDSYYIVKTGVYNVGNKAPVRS